MNEGLINYLANFITERRLSNFHEVLQFRTRHITVVLEDIYQSHNASAVLRSCDCFGIQDVHIVENKNEYTINPDVTLGSNKWLDVHRYNQNENNTMQAIQYLRKSNYKIVATTPHENHHTELNEFNVTSGKIALFFGSELNGVSEIVKKHADEYLKIPMFGFTESFNISVSAAIVLYEVTTKLHKSNIKWHLSTAEKQEILLRWIKKTIKHPEMLEQEYYRSINTIKR